MMHTYLRRLHTKWELNPTTRRPVTAVLIPGPQHPPKVKYFQVTIIILILTPTHPPKVKYQNMMQTVNHTAGKLKDHHNQSQAILQQGRFTHPSLKWQIVHRSMHDVIHAVREQHARAVTRGLLTQQRTLAANKLQCNAQIKKTSNTRPSQYEQCFSQTSKS